MARKINNKYKIIGIAQIYNELEKGNLKRFVKYIKPLVSELVIYDDGSTDGSFEYMQKITSFIIRGSRNDFKNELKHKEILLQKAISLNADFILWLDADEVLSKNSEEKLPKLCQYMIDKKLDALSIHEINLWRSSNWQRIDSLYDIGWFVRLWKVKPGLKFVINKSGLHQSQYPPMLKKIEKTKELSVIHYGFSNKKNLAYKYLTYKSHGQKGYNMLDRLISEDKLQTVKVPLNIFPGGLHKNDPKPQKLTFAQSLDMIERYRSLVFKPKYSIICLIYKSTKWLEFEYQQVLKYTNMKDAEFFFVANDATPEVLSYLKNNYIPHYIFNNTPKHKNEWYINNVYRAWNFAATKAKGDFIIFINSDMGLSPNWLDNLLAAYNGKNCITSRLVESGKMRSGQYGIEKNFGRSIEYYREESFQGYTNQLSEDKIAPGGLFMPLLVRKNQFLSVGGYPQGNIIAACNIFKPKIAKQGQPCISGDVVLMQKLQSKGISHQTSFNSIVYHFQEGEMDSIGNLKQETEKFKIAVANDLTTGTMGEKVLWNYLLEKLPQTYNVDTQIVGNKEFAKNAQVYINKNFPQTKVIIQNASFINTIDKTKFTIMFLQDNLRAMNKKSKQQEDNLKHADLLVANSIQTALFYPQYNFEIIPIGIDGKLFKPMHKSKLRSELGFKLSQKIGIFVGDFSEVKGWSEMKKIIQKNSDIFWILVTKTKDKYTFQNAKVYNQISQKQLAKLYNCANFFILPSPIETQALAALEAGFCNIPILMHETGIFKSFSQKEKNAIGIFTNDLNNALKMLSKKKFSPRKTLLSKNLTIDHTINQWNNLLEKALQQIRSKEISVSKKKLENKLGFQSKLLSIFRK